MPSLEQLPPQVAARIVDMGRIGTIVSGYFKGVRNSEEQRKAFSEVMSIAEIAPAMSWASQSPSDISAYHDRLWDIRRDSYGDPYQKLEGAVQVNNWAAVTNDDCQRLACEAELIFFRAALDRVPRDTLKRLLHACELLSCLNWLRVLV
jgi:hypothetical protein